MPAKVIKNKFTGRKMEIFSVLLPNGNLVIPKILRRGKPNFVGWVEVAPGDSDHKRWWPVRDERPDPRTKEYWAHVKKVAPEFSE